jgi:hypothetical protein
MEMVPGNRCVEVAVVASVWVVKKLNPEIGCSHNMTRDSIHENFEGQ